MIAKVPIFTILPLSITYGHRKEELHPIFHHSDKYVQLILSLRQNHLCIQVYRRHQLCFHSYPLLHFLGVIVEYSIVFHMGLQQVQQIHFQNRKGNGQQRCWHRLECSCFGDTFRTSLPPCRSQLDKLKRKDNN